ncbi:MAG TPA: GNAT family N-acetyltransferase [Candidatus Polarisedimenticolaceae bacterium]|nr:GNAT family N-acetyltransferase [Candidatus Polarisedimenticolaceae bacterium]
MALSWIHEDTPRWDRGKADVVGRAEPGVFEWSPPPEGGLVPGEWFRVESDGTVAGYGWMDCSWGDAEVSLAVNPDFRGRGVGGFILDHLDREAAARGVNYLYNTVGKAHPDAGRVTAWLQQSGFAPSGDGLLKRRVRPR